MRDRAFDDLVRRHAPAVNAYARAMTRDPWLAEDAVQETFLRAWKYQDTFDRRGSFEGWLIRICRNCVLDQYARRSPAESLDERTEVPTIGLASRAEIDDLLTRLPLAQREVLVLAGALGYDYETVAEMLNVPVGTVRSRLSRGRAALAELMARADGRDGDEVPA